MMSFATPIGCCSLLGWIYLGLLRGHFWQPLFADPAIEPEQWPSIDIIVPARDEADMLPQTLPSLLAQNYPGAWRIILVDDHSIDHTAETAISIAARINEKDRLKVVTAPALEPGWNGKVAAMQAGFSEGDGDFVLFTDADIEHTQDTLKELVARTIEKKLDLASLMVKLHCETFAEKLLIPAFVFFFGMLYPFERVNNPDRGTAAAAGGVMLVRRKTLKMIGGFKSIRGVLIDDCALAKAIKHHGGEDDSYGRIELTLSPEVKSLRVYRSLGDVWHMVARTAFTQLRYSGLILYGTIVGMGILFLAPLFGPLVGDFQATTISFIALFFMIIIYTPTILFYRLPAVWAITLPVAALIYIGATIDSARLYWQGRGGDWKGRMQA